MLDCFPTTIASEHKHGKQKKLTAFKADMENKQRLAWINTIKKGCSTDIPHFNFNKNTRLCIHHFHPSTMNIDENGKPSLKVGACPTFLLHECGSMRKKRMKKLVLYRGLHKVLTML